MSDTTKLTEAADGGLRLTPCSRCIVHGCENHKHQGRFVGDLCAPCHEYITTGRIGPTTSFLGRMDKGLDALKVISVADWKTAEALRSIKNELGVPQPEYPAPVANAVKIAGEALQSLTPTQTEPK